MDKVLELENNIIISKKKGNAMNLEDIFSQIAKENETTKQEVKNEIVSLVSALKNSSKIKERHLFFSLFGDAETLTAEEIVMRLAKAVCKGQ